MPGLALAHQLYLSLQAQGHGRDGTHALELALAGRNLLHASHPEFVSELGDMPALDVERSLYGQLRLDF